MAVVGLEKILRKHKALIGWGGRKPRCENEKNYPTWQLAVVNSPTTMAYHVKN